MNPTPPVEKIIEKAAYWSCGSCSTHHQTKQSAASCPARNRRSPRTTRRARLNSWRVSQLIELAREHGASFEEIGHKLGLASSTVTDRYHTHKRFKQKMEKDQ